MSVTHQAGFADSPAQFHVQFVVLTVSTALNLEMFLLATRRAHRLETGLARGLDRDLGICGLMVVMIVLLPVLDLDARAITGEALDLEFGRLPVALQRDLCADSKIDEVGPMRREIGEHRAIPGLNHEAVSENVGDLAIQSGSFVRHLFLLCLKFLSALTTASPRAEHRPWGAEALREAAVVLAHRP